MTSNPQIRLAAIALNQTPLDWWGNAKNVRDAIDGARQSGARLICLPELCLTGYGCEDAFLWPGTQQMAVTALGELLGSTRGVAASVGLPLQVEGRLFNVAALLVDGELRGFAAKRHLAGEGLHYEPRWFSPWPKGHIRQVEVLGRRVPVGDLVFELGHVRLGFEICEDAWVVERPGRELGQAGVHVVLNPSASHFAFGKHRLRRGLALSGARDFRCIYAYANLLGNEAGRAIYDGDALIARPTEHGPVIVAETRRLSFRDWQMACATVELPERSFSPEEEVTGRGVVQCDFSWPESPLGPTHSERTPSAAEDGELSKEQAFARVVALGLFDYLRKSRSEGFVVSLSGGADSAAVALLVRLMVRFAWAELGPEGIETKLSYFSPAVETEEALARRLLRTLYQATENSSSVTREAARAVADAAGARHHEFSVQEIVSNYRARLEEALGRELSWERDDIALQNIQARVRSPGAWMLANVEQALLLATSNRSEAAVGYATMDGDTSGGLSPIAGIDKAFLRKWLLFLERGGIEELGPVPALAQVNCQQPTAELRPPSASQTDESDLMPYEVLDALERLVVVSRLPLLEVQRQIRSTFPGYDPLVLDGWLRRFCRLFSSNQWKRERYAPSFHVDDANLDPKTWCRFPILSGGFARELAELESHARETTADRD